MVYLYLMKKARFWNIIFFLVWPVAAVAISLIYGVSAFWSPFLFYGPLAILLSFCHRKYVARTALISLLGLPLMIVVDYIAEVTGTWLWPLPASIFPFTLFNYVSVEVLIWIYFHFFLVILFYEYFFDHHKKIKPAFTFRSSLFLRGVLVIFAVFVLLYLFFPSFVHIPYWYLIFGSLLLLPPIVLEEMRYPKVFLKIFKAGMYFLYLNLLYELTAIKLGWWSFPSGQFIGQVSFFGIQFPFEEFFFWIVIFTMAILSFYEYFFDDER